MSYVYMKVLESAPSRYDRGMQLLTLGRVQRVYLDIGARIPADAEVLDLGCGTGALAVRLARQGARVTAIDISAGMLEQAATRVQAEGLTQRVELRQLGVAELDAFGDGRFGAVTSVLVLSELSDDEIAYALGEVRRLLRPGGRLLVADEVEPASAFGRLLSAVVRLPFVVLAYALTQTTTHRVRDLEGRVSAAGFRVIEVVGYLAGTLRLVVAA
ncbi:MAG: corrinoid protein-associated methyltransferase CpaM [Anaerolineae bacterium]|jgi:demethylmenaquinone methyltransferase/2-methoxy-6-polyprenyl-1,4-benzoquinol methylase